MPEPAGTNGTGRAYDTKPKKNKGARSAGTGAQRNSRGEQDIPRQPVKQVFFTVKNLQAGAIISPCDF